MSPDMTVKLRYEDSSKYISRFLDQSSWEHSFDDDLSEVIHQNTYDGKPLRASMETAMHGLLESKFVFHLHPINFNIFLCSQEGISVIKDLLNDFRPLLIPPVPPGFYLAQALMKEIETRKETPAIILLQNHGLIIHGNNLESLDHLTNQINQIVNNDLRSRNIDIDAIMEIFPSQKINEDSPDIFPDTVVFREQVQNLNQLSPEKRISIQEIFKGASIIEDSILKMGWKLNPLSSKLINYIKGMSQEKYRQEKSKN